MMDGILEGQEAIQEGVAACVPSEESEHLVVPPVSEDFAAEEDVVKSRDTAEETVVDEVQPRIDDDQNEVVASKAADEQSGQDDVVLDHFVDEHSSQSAILTSNVVDAAPSLDGVDTSNAADECPIHDEVVSSNVVDEEPSQHEVVTSDAANVVSSHDDGKDVAGLNDIITREGDENEDDAKFKNSARLFLSIHREEIAQRDAEILRLKAELHRVREGLKALEKMAELSFHCHIHDSDRSIVQYSQTTPHMMDSSVIRDKILRMQQTDQSLAVPSEIPIVSQEESVQLARDEPDVALKTILQIWECCMDVVQEVMNDDFPEEFMSDWSVVFWPDLEEKMPNILAFPLEPSNSPSAKRMRSMLVIALLAKSLEEYILTPNYFLEDDDELRYILSKMADTGRKNCLRGLLLTISEEEKLKASVTTFRVEHALEDTIRPIESLLPPEFCGKLRSTLSDLIYKVAAMWEPLQRCQSHYEVSTAFGGIEREWKTAQLSLDGVNLETVHSSTFHLDEVLMVLFPRVFAIDRLRKPAFTAIFPGVVLQKSQAPTMTEVEDVHIHFIPDSASVLSEPVARIPLKLLEMPEATGSTSDPDSEGPMTSDEDITDDESENETNDGDG